MHELAKTIAIFGPMNQFCDSSLKVLPFLHFVLSSAHGKNDQR